MRRPQGYTLIEVVIAIGIGSLLTLAATQVVVSSTRALTRTQTHTQILSGAEVGIADFVNDVTLSAPSSVTIVTSGLSGPSGDTITQPVISLNRQDLVDVTPFYFPGPSYTVYYVDDTVHQWVRDEWTSTLSNTGVALNTGQIQTILTTPTVSKVLASSVTGFTLATPTTGTVPAGQLQGTLVQNFDYTVGSNLTNVVTGAQSQNMALQTMNGAFTQTFNFQVRPVNGP
jgi:prepilin-type N-terminal cleavage/methylation domain-containing protein